MLRGVDLPAVLPAKRQDAARPGHMAVMVLDALMSDANTQATVAACQRQAARVNPRGGV